MPRACPVESSRSPLLSPIHFSNWMPRACPVEHSCLLATPSTSPGTCESARSPGLRKNQCTHCSSRDDLNQRESSHSVQPAERYSSTPLQSLPAIQPDDSVAQHVHDPEQTKLSPTQTEALPES